MKKTKIIAARRLPDGSWTRQRHVDMHPLEVAAYEKEEEAAVLASTIGEPHSKEDEHEWLLEHGPEFVKQKRQERKELEESIKPRCEALIEEFQVHTTKWHKHCERCGEHGHDHNTFDGDATLLLKRK